FAFSSLIILTLLMFQCTSPKGDRQENDNTSDNSQVHPDLQNSHGVLHNTKTDGYRGIWYMNQPLDNEYKFKYSGGLGTYPQQHIPLAIYSEAVNKTFFCYGGTDEENSTLLYMVSY